MQNLSEITSTQYTGGVDSSNYKDGFGIQTWKNGTFFKGYFTHEIGRAHV